MHLTLLTGYKSNTRSLKSTSEAVHRTDCAELKNKRELIQLPGRKRILVTKSNTESVMFIETRR